MEDTLRTLIVFSMSSSKGTWITKVEATGQPDSRQSVVYTIFSGNEHSLFSINHHTGTKHMKFCKIVSAGAVGLLVADVSVRRHQARFHQLSYANSSEHSLTHPFHFPHKYPENNIRFSVIFNHC